MSTETLHTLKVAPRTIAKIRALGQQIEVLKRQTSMIIETLFDNSEHAGKDLQVMGFEDEHILFKIVSKEEQKVEQPQPPSDGGE